MTFSHSDLTMERYHSLSDMTMDTLLESLEVLLDDLGNPSYELEYHVRIRYLDDLTILILKDFSRLTERCSHSRTG